VHRSHLRSLLQIYHPQDPFEIMYKVRMLKFLGVHPDCFERSCAPGHFTASAWLLDHEGARALLMHHRKLDIWVQPGGHCDGEGDLLVVAIKEAEEESGLVDIAPLEAGIFDIDIHEIPARPGEPAHLHYDVRFLLQVRSDQALIQNIESKELRWFGKDRGALPNQNAGILRLFDKWVGYPQFSKPYNSR